MRQLLPEPVDPVDPLDVYADVPEAPGRPAVRVVMVQSIDGAIAVDGVSGPLGGPPDRRVYLTNRSFADVVLVAAGTARAEGYGPAKLTPELVAAREARGQPPVPRIAVVSGKLDLDWDTPFFTEAVARPIVVTADGAPADRLERAAEVADVVVAGSGRVDLGEAVGALASHGAGLVVCEGGPSLNGQLGAAGLIDELCLSISPRLVGGDSRRILTGPTLPGPPRFAVRSLCEEDGFLFLRLRPE